MLIINNKNRPPIKYGLFLPTNSKNTPANAGPIILANDDTD